MKSKVVRLLAGGLAAVTLMSSLAVTPVFADEEYTTTAIETEAVADNSGDSESSESVAESASEETSDSEAAGTEEAQSTEEAGTEEETQSTEEGRDEAENQAEEESVEETDTAETSAEENAGDETDVQATEESDETAESVAAGENENKSTDLISSQDAEDNDLLSEDDGEEPVLGSAAPATTELSEQDKKLADEEAEKIVKDIKSAEDLMKFFDSKDELKVSMVKKSEAAQDQKNAFNSEYYENLLKATIASALKKAFDKIPGTEFIADPLKDLIMDGLGLQPKKDKTQEYFNKTNNKIDELKGETLRGMENVGSITSYGTKLDAFNASTSAFTSKIAIIKKDSKTENEKNLAIAALIGGKDRWNIGETNVFSKMYEAAQTMRSKSHAGLMSDIKNRNLFDVIYDYFKENAMFSGEAMNNANSSIERRTKQYVKDCKVLIDVLRAHEKVADMSDKDVAELNEADRATYNKIKTDKKEIRRQMKLILGTFTGCKDAESDELKSGIFDAAKEYSQKDKLIFFDKQGSNIYEIKISNKLYTQNSENYDIKELKKHSALNKEQVKKLQNHVNDLGITMTDYLKRLGVDTKEIDNTDRTVYLSTLDSKYTYLDSVPDAFKLATDKTQSQSYLGYNVKEKGAKESAQMFFDGEKRRVGLIVVDKDLPNVKGGMNVTLQAR